MQKTSNKIILLLSAFLILDPALRILSFKISTGMDWTLLWDNIVQNGNVSVFRFVEFWLLTPLAGLFLLTLSRVAYLIYSALTFYKFYSLVSYTPFDWPYFAARPHIGAFMIISLNMIFVLILMWPLIKKYLLSYHFKNIWDARGRYEASFKASLFINGIDGGFAGSIKNISSGGALFKVTQELKPLASKASDEAILVIQSSSGEHLNFEVELINVSISEHKDLIGMEFVNMGPKLSLALMNILLELRSQSLAKEKRAPSEAL